MKFFKLLNITTLLFLLSYSAYSTELTVSLSNNNHFVYHLSSANPTQDLTIDVGSVKKIAIDIVSKTQAPQVELINPLGIVHTPDTLNTYLSDLSTSAPLGALFFQPGHHVQMTVIAPTSGRWKIRLSLPQGVNDILGNASVIRQGGVAINVFTSRRIYNQGRPVVIGSALFNDGVAVNGATINAELIEKTNPANVYTVNLHDSGSTPDSASGDGIYTGSVNDLQVGDYTIRVLASVAGSQLETFSDLRIINPIGNIDSLVGNNGVDTNGDGLFEFIALKVELDIFTAGKYELQGHIEVGDETISAVRNAELSVGKQTLDLLIKAEDIRKYLKVDGPYNIKDLMLVTRFNDIAGSNLLADKRENIGQTDAYQLTELQRPPVQILSGITTSTSDYDNDQLIDRLTTTFKVDLLVTGSFTWSGSLKTKDGITLGTSSGSAYLTRGQHSLSFSFPGIPIGESGIDGPYFLRSVAIYGNGLAALSPEVGETRAFMHTEFEGSAATFEFLRLKIKSLVITGRGGKPRADGIRVSLLAKLNNAEEKAIAEQIKTAVNVLKALSNEINAQSGKHISPLDASELSVLIDKISSNL